MKFKVGDYITRTVPRCCHKGIPEGIFRVTEINGKGDDYGVFISKPGRDKECFRSDIFRKCTEKEIRLNRILFHEV